MCTLSRFRSIINDHDYAKDYANHYVYIEITGYRALYGKSIAGRGVARFISWLGTAGPVDCFNKSVSDRYIRVYRSFWQGTAKFG